MSASVCLQGKWMVLEVMVTISNVILCYLISLNYIHDSGCSRRDERSFSRNHISVLLILIKVVKFREWFPKFFMLDNFIFLNSKH